MYALEHNLKIFVFILLISFKTSLTWGFSVSSVEKYTQVAIEKKLWLNPQWIKLGHYEKSLFGQYSSAFRQGFFLNDKGYASPELELMTTIQALYSESELLTEKLKRHPQCHYAARAKWLNQILNVSNDDVLPCSERLEWKKKLNAKSVSIIFAASDLGNASSSFGHTFLKLINPENAQNKDLIDYGIDYSAETDASGNLLYALKGLAGFYPGRFAMLPYHQKIRDYINLDGRDIWEYNLNFTDSEVDFLIDHLLEMENAKAPYYFFSDNCSYQILKTLEVVRPDVNLADTFNYFVIPIDTVKKIKNETTWIAGTKFKKSLKSEYLLSYSKLGLLQKKALDNAVDQLIIPNDFELSNSEKAQVYETATKYFAVKSYRTGIDSDDQQYKLSSERAVLGSVIGTSELQKIQPPHESHDSSALYFQSGLIKNQYSDIKYHSFKFRNALHDIEQIDFGTVSFSQNEMATLEFKYIENSKKIQFNQLTFLNLINLNPVTQLDRNFSWKVKAALQDAGRTDFEGSGGLSFDSVFFPSSRLATFLTVRSWYDSEMNLQGAAPEILYVFRPFQKLGWSLSASYFLINKNTDYLRLKSKINFNLNKKFDLQFSAENSYFENSVYQAGLVYNFLM
jgi:hypothetical protein